MNDLTAGQSVPPVAPDADDDDHLGHFYCCDENKALCGSDLGDADEIEADDSIDCVVCVALSTPRRPCSPGCQRV